MWTDSHCHIPYDRLDPVDVELDRARAAGVGRFVTVGTDLDQSRAALEAARTHHDVVATVGLHPHDATDGLGPVLALLDEALADPALGPDKVVAVGECGFDFHYDHSPRPTQRDVFAAQVAAANERDLALVIHTREAWAETFDVLDEVGVPARTVFHCFTGGPDEAAAAVERGCHISFSGIITFPSAPELREAAAAVPLASILVETDAPYLAPVPHRGKVNRPAFVPLVGAAVAEARGVDSDEIEQATTVNAARVFRLPSD